MATTAEGTTLRLIDEVRLLWNSLVQQGERLHEGEAVSMSMRAVLEYLARNGPMNVPSIARARRVSRQHIQGLVNALMERGLVTTADNPAHQRSPLIVMTDAGGQVIRRMQRREQRVLDSARESLSDRQMREAAKVLRALRTGIETGMP